MDQKKGSDGWKREQLFILTSLISCPLGRAHEMQRWLLESTGYCWSKKKTFITHRMGRRKVQAPALWDNPKEIFLSKENMQLASVFFYSGPCDELQKCKFYFLIKKKNLRLFMKVLKISSLCCAGGRTLSSHTFSWKDICVEVKPRISCLKKRILLSKQQESRGLSLLRCACDDPTWGSCTLGWH